MSRQGLELEVKIEARIELSQLQVLYYRHREERDRDRPRLVAGLNYEVLYYMKVRVSGRFRNSFFDLSMPLGPI